MKQSNTPPRASTPRRAKHNKTKQNKQHRQRSKANAASSKRNACCGNDTVTKTIHKWKRNETKRGEHETKRNETGR